MLTTFWTALLERTLVSRGEPCSLQPCGAALMLAGSALRAAAVLTLGRSFVTGFRAATDRPLVQHRIYSWIRHPSETGNLSIVVGACLLLESRLAPAFLLALVPIILRRIGREDQSLAYAHGCCFRQYTRRVKRLIPWVY
jgi:protein-S-isoprenylcysteine O-methyltransferase Ste14